MSRRIPQSAAAELDLMHRQALQFYSAGQRDEAGRLCRNILLREPAHADAAYLLGALALDASQAEQALVQFRSAVAGRPAEARYHHALGEAHRALNQVREAADCFEAALRLDPKLAAAHHALGLLRFDQNDTASAIAAFRHAIAAQPDYARAHLNLGRALQVDGKLEQAGQSYREALRLSPDYAIAHNNLGAVLHILGKPDEAALHLRRALELKPDYPEAHYNLGNALQALEQFAPALACYDAALRLRPDHANAQLQSGIALEALSRREQALSVYEALVRQQPGHGEGWQRLAVLLMASNQWDRAHDALQRAAQLLADPQQTLANLVYCKAMLCDWSTRDADRQRLLDRATSRLQLGQPCGVPPFFTSYLMHWPPPMQLDVARAEASAIALRQQAARQELAQLPRAPRGERLRIGYLSGDFYDHAVSHLTQPIFGLHDRGAFEVFAYSFGPDDGSAYRRRIAADSEHFVDVRALSNRELARRIRGDGIDILIDMMGYSGFTRFEVLAQRPAPVQASWLSYAATTGAEFIDYLIGDHVVTPPQAAAQFSETLVRLPHCFLATDRQEIAALPMLRGEHGLPQDGVVFVSWNNSYKFEPGIFDVWMRILRQVPGSVLWLKSGGATMQRNLQHEAQARGIDPSRLVFDARILVKPQHLARLGLADLFLDTHLCNAHTTAIDALWAGVPVLSCPGQTFASRVGASLLEAVGLPELIVPDLGEYERSAVRLAQHPAELRAIRARLALQRTQQALFDTPRFVRDLERALRQMWQQHQAGTAPQPIDLTLAPH